MAAAPALRLTTRPSSHVVWPRLGNLDPNVMSDVLQEAKVEIIPRELCTTWEWWFTRIHPENMCAGKIEGGVSPCKVGSGGYLLDVFLPALLPRYPQCLHMLELLQYEHFRKELVNAQCAKFIDEQQILHWQHYSRKRVRLQQALAEQPLPQQQHQQQQQNPQQQHQPAPQPQPQQNSSSLK
nr:mediator of RNA polymerase II transcription subunit 31 [Anolis sagrei ordinatus]